MKKQLMLIFITLSLLIIVLCVASSATQVNALPNPPKQGQKVIVTMSVTDINGNPVQDMSSVPLSTVVYIWGSYAETPGNEPGNIEVTVCYSSTSPYHWSAPVVLVPSTPETSPFGSAGNEIYLADYQLSQPGYYLFELTGNSINSVSNRITDTVTVTAGPVLSEPATLSALALCFVAVGAVLVRKKKPAKQ